MSECYFKLKVAFVEVLWWFGLLHSSTIEYIRREVYWQWRWSRYAKRVWPSPYIALTKSREGLK